MSLIGQIYGRLEIISEKWYDDKKVPWIKVKCTCGSNIIKDVRFNEFKCSSPRSCGCAGREKTIARNISLSLNLDKTALYELYINQNMCPTHIATKLNCEHATIIKYLKKYNIYKGYSVYRGKQHVQFKGYEEIRATYFNNLKRNASIRNIKFDITIEQIWDLFLKQDKKCALSGVNLEQFSNMKNKGNASLDRIDSNKDYTIDNVQWVHKDINFMKSNINNQIFIEWCRLINNNNPQY